MSRVNLLSTVEMSFYITKASLDKATGKMSFAATASDILPDLYAEQMSLELYNDFIGRAKSGEHPPEQFCSEAWCGGMPYMSVAHYSDLDGKGLAGKVTSLYVDGIQLKVKGEFYDTELGRACFRSVCADLYNDQNKSREDKVRISIGFLDWEHAHNDKRFARKSLTDRCPMCAAGVGEKVYLKGHLLHLALTRVPVNRRTDIQPLEVRSMTTRKEDAASIVGEALAEELEQESVVGKSEALVERDEAEVETPQETAPVEAAPEPTLEVAPAPVVEESDYLPLGGAMDFDQLEQMQAVEAEATQMRDNWYALEGMMYNIMQTECGDKKKMMAKAINGFKGRLEMKALSALAEMSQAKEKPVPHALDAAFSELKAAFDAAMGDGNSDANARLVAIQASFNQLGETLRSAVNPPEPVSDSTAEQAPANPDVMSAVAEMIRPLADQIALLTTQLSTTKSVEAVQTATPARKSLTSNPDFQKLLSAPAQKPTSFGAIARKSVGLPS